MLNALVAPCGMNCALCLAFQREKNRCDGCRIHSAPKPHLIRCVIKNCELLEKTESKFCFDCPDYPCIRVKQLDKRYRKSYGTSLMGNLEQIKRDGMDIFLAAEQVKWRCKQCGKTRCIHRPNCLSCHAPAEGSA